MSREGPSRSIPRAPLRLPLPVPELGGSHKRTACAPVLGLRSLLQPRQEAVRNIFRSFLPGIVGHLIFWLVPGILGTSNGRLPEFSPPHAFPTMHVLRAPQWIVDLPRLTQTHSPPTKTWPSPSCTRLGQAQNGPLCGPSQAFKEVHTRWVVALSQNRQNRGSGKILEVVSSPSADPGQK